jgi:hypothetical protein
MATPIGDRLKVNKTIRGEVKGYRNKGKKDWDQVKAGVKNLTKAGAASPR